MADPLGLQFGDRLDPLVRDELEQLVAALNIRLALIPPTLNLGAWVNSPYPSSAFAGNAAMTWTVELDDYLLQYSLINKRLAIQLRLRNFSVGGTPDTDLILTLPQAFVAAQDAGGTHSYSDNAGGTGVFTGTGPWFILQNTRNLVFRTSNSAAWSASANNSALWMSTTFRVV